MTKIKILLTLLFFGVVAAIIPASAGAISKLYLDPGAATHTKDTEFTVKVQITAVEDVFGSDATINFASSDFSLVSVENGGFFSDFVHADGTGIVELHGYFSSLFESKSGNGTVANLKFKSLKSSGTGSIVFTCTASGNDTNIINLEGENVLSCGSLNQSNITFANQSSNNNDNSGDSSNNTVGEPNSCGGTCGSNFNCKSDLFCYQGFCRNAACPTSATCGCPTPAPSPKLASAATPKASPTPQTVVLEPFTTPNPVAINDVNDGVVDEGTEVVTQGSTFGNILIILLILFGTGAIVYTVRRFTNNRNLLKDFTNEHFTKDVEPTLPIKNDSQEDKT